MINNKYITQNTIAEKLNVNVRTIKRNFKVLIDNNIIERVGSDKNGYWEVIN
ncbi:MAG: HTH domain-containing protein [Bacilli bacterium]|nr:HTH domain-containing protein [Bacilli bacterium]